MAGMDSIKPNGRPFTFSKQSEDHLQTVVPSLQAVARRALALTKVDFTIISGRRDMAEQRRLVRQWVSRTLHSRHLTGHALDLVPLDPATGKGRFSRDLAIEVAVAFYEAGYQFIPLSAGAVCGRNSKISLMWKYPIAAPERYDDGAIVTCFPNKTYLFANPASLPA
ncbi:MAG: hypothetical protein ACPH3M_02855 [Candidatus Puniceispirillales bacterium]